MNLLEKFGVIAVGLLTTQFTVIIFRELERWVKRRRRPKLKTVGRWAIVLGADSPLGDAYVWALGARGFNVVLLGHDFAALTCLAAEVEKSLQVASGVLTLDVTSPKGYRRASKALANLDVGVLINAPNLWRGLSRREHFLQDAINDEVVMDSLLSVTRICSIVLPGMLMRGRGIVVNVSGLSAIVPSPHQTLYGASAAFLDKFSSELRREFSDDGLRVDTLYPGLIADGCEVQGKESWFAPTPEDYVSKAIRLLGTCEETCVWKGHSFIWLLIHLVDQLSPAAAAFVSNLLAGMEDPPSAEPRNCTCRSGTPSEYFSEATDC